MERRRTVLVADDSREVLEAAESVLREGGYHVITAADGAETLKVVRQEHPDLVVLDLLMPKMTGFDVLREIRQDARVEGTPVLVMSGVYKDNVLGFLQQLGAQGFLEKQNLRDSLLFRVRGVLGPAA